MYHRTYVCGSKLEHGTERNCRPVRDNKNASPPKCCYHCFKGHVAEDPGHALPRHGESNGQRQVAEHRANTQPQETESPAVTDLSHLFRVLQVHVALKGVGGEIFSKAGREGGSRCFSLALV